MRKGRKRDPRLSANAWNGTYSESGITIDFLPGDSMHLTSITLFIRGDKQFVEKKEDGGATPDVRAVQNFYRALASVAIFENIAESA